MGDPNEPRIMTPRREEKARTNDIATGDAGRDGFTRIARRSNGEYGSSGIYPQVGARDWNRGPRFEEDC